MVGHKKKLKGFSRKAVPRPRDRLLPPWAGIASYLRPHPTGFALLISQQALKKKACIPRNTILIE